MVYARGNKNDYDQWALDNPGWSYDDVLPYFIKSEDNRNPYIAANKKYHGTGGYLTVQEPAVHDTPSGGLHPGRSRNGLRNSRLQCGKTNWFDLIHEKLNAIQ
jgi:hypothetical protein